MTTLTTTLPHGSRVRIELQDGTPVADMDRAVRLLAVFESIDRDKGRAFAERFPAVCYSARGVPIGNAYLIR